MYISGSKGSRLSDYGFRYYSSDIGRFTGVDPIADQYAHVSVYNYAENKPIAFIDLWGLQAATPEKPKATTFEKPIHLFTRSPKIFVEGMKVAFDQVKNMYGNIYFSTGDGIEVMGHSGVKGGIEKDREGTSNSIVDMNTFFLPRSVGAPVDKVKVVGVLKESVDYATQGVEVINEIENLGVEIPWRASDGVDTIIINGEDHRREKVTHKHGETQKVTPIETLPRS